MRSTPMMANPHEYRESLWSLIYTGEMTPEMQKRAKQAEFERAKKAIGTAPPKKALDELAAVMEQAERLRAKRESVE